MTDSAQAFVETDTQPCYGFVRGEAVTELPTDLYIPPDALEVVLELFEGPLDLLLYLIKKRNLDIVNIPVAEITHQYMTYVEAMSYVRLELAADYLEMAALLAEIKSRMLLPSPPGVEGAEEEDPRAELIRRLQEYERFKLAAVQIDELQRVDRDCFIVSVEAPRVGVVKPYPTVDLQDLLWALKEVLKRADLQSVHTIQREVLSVRDKMSRILGQLNPVQFTDFVSFFESSEGKLGVVVTFLAILELMREMLIELVQREPFGTIYVRAV